MPKLTIKQEKFCQLYIENGGNASEAYRGSYNASNMKEHTINCKASLLLKKGDIEARLANIQAKHAEKHEITVEWLTEKYKDIILLAMDGGKLGEAKGALDSLGKLHGLIVDKKRIDGNINHNHKQEPVSETLGWVGGMLGRAETGQTKEPLPN